MAHAALLDVLGDGAVVDLLETALEFCCPHAGNLGQTLHRNFRSVMVAQVGSDRLNTLNVLCCQPPSGCRTLFLILHHQRQRFGYLALIKQFGGDPISAVILKLCKEPGHFREVCCLVDLSECLHRVVVFVRILLFEIILIVGGHDLNADGANGNIFVDQHPVG